MSQLVLDLSSCMWIPFPVSYSMCPPLFCLNVCIIWHQAILSVIPFLLGEGTGSFCCCTTRMHAGHLPCASCWEGLTAHTELMSTPETDILLSLLYVSKVFFTQCLTVLFSLVTLISECSWQKCSDFYSCHWTTYAACLTIWLLPKHYPTISLIPFLFLLKNKIT